MRKLPVYLLIDTSGSMEGEPIQAVNVGLQALIAYLRQDPYALDSVNISIITFDQEVKNILPLTELSLIQLPEINTPRSGPTHLGEALKMVCEKVDEEVNRSTQEQKGDWMPLLFVMTDGKPSDTQTFNKWAPIVRNNKFANIIACAAGPKADESILKKITDTVVSLDTTDLHTFGKFFEWVSNSISVGNRSVGANNEILLPPKPDELNFVL